MTTLEKTANASTYTEVCLHIYFQRMVPCVENKQLVFKEAMDYNIFNVNVPTSIANDAEELEAYIDTLIADYDAYEQRLYEVNILDEETKEFRF